MRNCKKLSWSYPASIAGLLLAGCPQGDLNFSGQPEPAGSDESGESEESPTSGPPTSGPVSGDESSTTPAPSNTSTPTNTSTGASPGDGDTSTGGEPHASSTGGNPDDTSTGESSGGSSADDTTTGESTGAVDPSDGDSSASDASTSEDTGDPPDDTTGAPEPPKYAVSVVVAGLDGDAAEAGLNAQELLALAGPGEFAFTTELAAGEPYAVKLTELPVHYTCAVKAGAGVMPAHDVAVAVTCAPKPSTTLVIAEVGFGYWLADAYWLEVVNTSAQAQSLAGVTLRSPAAAVDADYNVTDKGVQEFALPNVQLAPGGRLVLRGAVPDETAAGPGLALLALPGSVLPAWRTDFGALELHKAGASIDYVAWGNIPVNQIGAFEPKHPSAWPGYPAGLPVPPTNEAASRGRSLARALAPADSNAAADFTTVEFSTPGGPNDTHGCTADVDGDGLPDCSEAAGKTYAGIDLYSHGARANKPDIFVEVDAMNPKGGDGVTTDLGMIPSKVALDRIVAKFAENGYALHFDVGDLFDKAPGIDPSNHDLGGGSTLPFGDIVCFDNDPGCTWMVDLKAKNFALARLKSFHYGVYANKNYKGTLGGQGEVGGNDFYVGLGEHTFNTETMTDTNVLVNNQILAVMHELGHNLGLSHGGFSSVNGDALIDEANWKPNYFSIMNYLYSTGLPLNTSGDRYYYKHEDENPACQAKNIDFCSMSASVCGLPSQLRADYSHGLGGTIDTAAVVETKGLLQPNSVGVDFDCDGVTEVQPYASKLYAAVDGQNVALTTLRDHDDWHNLNLFFTRRWSGINNGEVQNPAASDVQPRAAVDELSPALLAWLRRR